MTPTLRANRKEAMNQTAFRILVVSLLVGIAVRVSGGAHALAVAFVGGALLWAGCLISKTPLVPKAHMKERGESVRPEEPTGPPRVRPPAPRRPR